jgi:hypothetical protein
VGNIIFNLATVVAKNIQKSPRVAKIESSFADRTEKWPST